MVGTSQVNQTGADAKVTVTDIKKRKGTHEIYMWQHNQLPLVFAAWSDNTVVKSSGNFHFSIIIQNGVQQRIKIDKVRQRNPVGVPVPIQYKEY